VCVECISQLNRRLTAGISEVYHYVSRVIDAVSATAVGAGVVRSCSGWRTPRWRLRCVLVSTQMSHWELDKQTDRHRERERERERRTRQAAVISGTRLARSSRASLTRQHDYVIERLMRLQRRSISILLLPDTGLWLQHVYSTHVMMMMLLLHCLSLLLFPILLSIVVMLTAHTSCWRHNCEVRTIHHKVRESSEKRSRNKKFERVRKRSNVKLHQS